MPKHDTVYGRYRPIKDISVADCVTMYNLFIQYYDNTPLDTFVRDMSKKTGVFVIYQRSDDAIVGFSTIITFNVQADGRTARCLFSGDTVVDRRYWGTSALRITTFLYVLRQKILHPFTPLYWYLISMGYRTYMVMANNFPNYYPSVDGDDPHLRQIAIAASERLFPGMLDEERMMIHFGEDACKLKGDVTPISDAERSNRKIAFFEKRNPNWMHGDEMPCVGAFDFAMIWGMISEAPKRLFHLDYKKRAAARVAKQAQGRPGSTPDAADSEDLSQAR